MQLFMLLSSLLNMKKLLADFVLLSKGTSQFFFNTLYQAQTCSLLIFLYLQTYFWGWVCCVNMFPGRRMGYKCLQVWLHLAKQLDPYWEPLAGKGGRKNDLFIALITYFYVFANIFYRLSINLNIAPVDNFNIFANIILFLTN